MELNLGKKNRRDKFRPKQISKNSTVKDRIGLKMSDTCDSYNVEILNSISKQK